MRRFFFWNSLTLFFIALTLLASAGTAAAGFKEFNEQQRQHDEQPYSFGRYLGSSHFAEAMSENWQSEFLQFATFFLAAVWLFQKGSNESKTQDNLGLESDQKQMVRGYAKSNSPAWGKVEGWRRTLYSNSLLLVMALFFLFAWAAQSLSGWTLYNQDQMEHGDSTVSWSTYLGTADFWEKTLQNWQSEFMAIASIAIFSVFLRQRGSPDSKPVGAPHSATSLEG